MDLPLDTLHSYDPVEIATYLIGLLKSFFNSPSLLAWVRDFFLNFKENYPFISALILGLAIFLILILLVLLLKYLWAIKKFHDADDELEYATPPEGEAGKLSNSLPTGDRIKDRWRKVLEHVESADPANWRMAILEADIILDEMLDRQKYDGETIGEKLKQVEKSDFLTIDNAWEAHKIRNQIAHEGSEFMISQREARRVIGLFESVFKEFYLI